MSLKVLITGASSGIGLALAEEYVRRGAVLGPVARRSESLAAFAARFPQASISIYPADVRDADALADAARRFIAEHGAADIVIANAGISRGALTGHGDLDTFRAVMDTNYFGMVATFEPFVASMTAARRGTLDIASVAGVGGKTKRAEPAQHAAGSRGKGLGRRNRGSAEAESGSEHSCLRSLIGCPRR